MRLVLFRSAWGLNLRADAARACASVRAAGFDGIEASLTDIGGSQAEQLAFGKAAQAEGLELILSAYSSWVNYEGVYEAKPVSAHVSTMLKELESLADLNGSLPLPLRLVNAHSGSDAWSEAEACEYFGALAQVCVWPNPYPEPRHSPEPYRLSSAERQGATGQGDPCPEPQQLPEPSPYPEGEASPSLGRLGVGLDRLRAGLGPS